MAVASINDRKANGHYTVNASEPNTSGDESLRKLIPPVVLIFLLCLGMVSAIVYATDNEDAGKCTGGSGKCDGGNRNEGNNSNAGGIRNDGNGDSRYGIDSSNGKSDDAGNRKSNNNGNGDGIRNDGDGGNRKGIGNDIVRRRIGNGNEGNAMVKDGHDQKSTGDVGSTTAVVQHTVSIHVVQASVVVLLVSYTAEATPSASTAWWSFMESNAERLFRKFFFLTGSVGEKIKRKNVLKNRKRREIYLFIVKNPFSHFRRITRIAGVGPNEGLWHLRILEKMDLIKSEYVGRYLTYHANNSNHILSRDNQPICLIPNSNATKILDYLLRNPGIKITHLTKALMINRNTISYHIKRLQTSGLVERVGGNGLRLSPVVEDHGQGLALQPRRLEIAVSPAS